VAIFGLRITLFMRHLVSEDDYSLACWVDKSFSQVKDILLLDGLHCRIMAVAGSRSITCIFSVNK